MGKRRSKEADVVLPPLGKTELSELCRRPGSSAAGLPKSDGRWPHFLGKRRRFAKKAL
ncbi:hypothetical protein [Ructibacterium gallinarum]|uniref:Uncharacterized protein n=1 Tax=Ructibacterium gallinarum TaxID=2779355 RepID=A0A9D5M7P9_9FIRM|nr:hypothetical protein [Ructibacterium gallinarum]MBE5041087.1 hypothetical protein [Ructibacterium gallinarum]